MKRLGIVMQAENEMNLKLQDLVFISNELGVKLFWTKVGDLLNWKPFKEIYEVAIHRVVF